MLTEYELRQFTGTHAWHRWSSLFQRHVLTDGARYLAEAGGAWWLMDAIASHHHSVMQLARRDGRLAELQIWKLRRTAGRRAVLECWADTGDDERAQLVQRIAFTDFPLPEVTLYVEPLGTGEWCILLPGEH